MNNRPSVKWRRLNPDADIDIPLPRYMTPKSSGMDVRAAVEDATPLAKGEIAVIPTGFAMALPDGYEAQIRPRSGLAARHGVTVINSPGTIDADYRGEIKIAVINLGKKDYVIQRGDRIAQMVIQPVCQATFRLVDELDDTQRGAGGFGHTGVK